MAGQSFPSSIGLNQTIDLVSPAFTIRSVAVDNPGTFWIHFPAASLVSGWVPPRTFGAIVRTGLNSPAPVRVNTVDVPTGFVNPATDSAMASLLALEEALPPSAGTPVAATTGAQKSLYNNNTVLPLVGTTTFSVSLDPLMTGIRVIFNSGSSTATGANSVSFVGDQVGGIAVTASWTSTDTTGPSIDFIYPINAGLDTKLNFTIVSNVSGPGHGSIIVLALYEPVTQPVILESANSTLAFVSNTFQGSPVNITDRAGRLIGIDQPYGAPYPTSAAAATVDAYISSVTPGATTNIISFGAGTLAAGGFYDISVLFAYGATAGPADDVRVFVNGAFLAAMLVDPIANRAGPEQIWRRMYVGNPSTAVTLQTIAGSGTATYRALMRLTRVT